MRAHDGRTFKYTNKLGFKTKIEEISREFSLQITRFLFTQNVLFFFQHPNSFKKNNNKTEKDTL